jgi:hypothetical protein
MFLTDEDIFLRAVAWRRVSFVDFPGRAVLIREWHVAEKLFVAGANPRLKSRLWSNR